MQSLFFGLVAAVAWGLHDFCVRYVSQRTPIYAAILTVLVAGLCFQTIVMTAQGSFEPISPHAIFLSFLAGVFFTTASIGLYKAFSVGPVRLVAPIIASYPVLSVGWAAISGNPVSLLQWLAVFTVIAGVSVVAAISNVTENPEQKSKHKRTILWAVLSGVGFAATFAFGQAATDIAPDMPVILVTRLAAIATLLGIMLLCKLPLLLGRNQLPLLGFMGLLDGLALASVLSVGGLPKAEYASVAASTFGMITILLTWAFLKETMTRTQWSGVILVFAGIGYLAL
ncbi:EamA family transporter [Pseudohalocynthiibacter sp. F2068]|jgi:drug/metabolite transporter (DMT)-like permease|uniref:EamA family transporter n=1 Tax=Pseudohalocynthiibacter sp. F2068 TaxID=2926418 RepID=UPI001FF12C04|nr:EamA family transporter [Pseudohalocynthiibacter sp. F2068]MCK0103949.1 DMT family transporter [Pseudohalocynthiibacter sp. F2068]